MTYREKRIRFAKKWFALNNLIFHQDGESFWLSVGEHHFVLSHEEVDYRAGLYVESKKLNK